MGGCFISEPTACEEEEEVDEDEDNIDDEVNMDDDEEGTGESKKKVRFSENTKDPRYLLFCSR